MAKRSSHQERIIKRYYDNREEIAIQRLQELVTELYLCESSKKRQQHWKHIRTHLEKLKVADDTIDHLEERDNAELVAQLLKRLMQKHS